MGNRKLAKVHYIIIGLLTVNILYFITLSDENSQKSIATNKITSKEKANRKRGHPDLHSQIQRERRTPSDKNSPEYPPNYLVDELKKAQSQRPSSRIESEFNFIERGPANIAGRTRALVVLPSDSTEKTWLAGSVSGGLWKTIDAGKSWINLTNNLPNLSVNTIGVSKSNKNLIYIGTGEPLYWNGSIDGSGIFKTLDGGATWLQIVNPETNPDFRNIGRLIVDPNNDKILLATTSTGSWEDYFKSAIYRSTDEGNTWKKVIESDRNFDDLEFEKNNFSIQYASVNSEGVYKSTDAGIRWVKKSFGLTGSGRLEMDISKLDPKYIWVSASNQNSAQLFVTSDRAESWSLVSDTTLGVFDFLDGQGTYDNTILAHPYNVNAVYVGGVDLWKFELTNDSTKSRILEIDQGETKNFMKLIVFTTSSFGALGLGQIPIESIVNVEIRFGQGTQLAHRFTVNSQGSGVPDNGYLYKDYINVPFQVWDVTNNQQLMISFRDQQEDSVWNLIHENTANHPNTHSREYLYIHNVAYKETADTSIAIDGGIAFQQMYNFWPVLSDSAIFDSEHLPISKMTISNKEVISLYRKSFNISDSRNQYEGNNANLQLPDRTKDGIHPDHHVLLPINKNDQNKTFKILNTNDGGVYVSKLSENPGVVDDDFLYVSLGYNTTQFYGADKMPGTNRYIGGTQDNGTWITAQGQEGSSTANYNFAIGGDGFEVIWNNKDSLKVIGSVYNNDFERSLDGGQTWIPASDGITENDGPFGSRLSNTREFPDRIFAVGKGGVYVSQDFGGKWEHTTIESNLYVMTNWTDIEVSRANPNIIWLGSYLDEQYRIFVSTDGGRNFNPTKKYSGEVLGFVSGVGTHPSQTNTAYILFSFSGRPKILKTTNLGETWSDISGFEGNSSSDRGFPNVAVNCLLVFPNDENRIWVGSEIGIIESTDGGASWGLLQSNLPPVNVNDFKIQDDQIIVATFGRGIWSVRVDGIEKEYVFAPTLNNLWISPSGDVNAIYQFNSKFDSTFIFINDKVVHVFFDNEVGDSTISFSNPSLNGEYRIKTVAYLEGNVYNSSVLTELFFEPKDVATGYASDFTESFDDFVGKGFKIGAQSGLASAALNSDHPYKTNSNFFTILKTPIQVENTNALISFREVVLVETGEPETSFGDLEFWDYVIVEGTKDGLNWKPLIDGYDSNAEPIWLEAYENEADGSGEMMRERTIDILETFDPGNEILIRFRLFSDPNAVGWGWAIDDLVIQEAPLGIVQETIGDFSIQPNPIIDNAMINYQLKGDSQGQISIFDLNGRVIHKFDIDSSIGSIFLEKGNMKAGLYIVQLNTNTGKKIKKLIIR